MERLTTIERQSSPYANKRYARLSLGGLFLLALLSFVIVSTLIRPTVSTTAPDITIPISLKNAPAPPSTTTLPAPSSGSFLGLNVYDNNHMWHTETKVDIFEHGDARVNTDGSGQSDHVIAPGTSNNYTFRIKNSEDYYYEYALKIKGGEKSRLTLPVKVQILAPDGASLTGGQWLPIARVGKTTHMGKLKPGGDAEYIIKWAWDFERDQDIYDTLLGDTAVSEELACYFHIELASQYVLDENGAPKTGDETNLTAYWIIFGASSSMLLLLVIILWKRRQKNKNIKDKARKHDEHWYGLQ